MPAELISRFERRFGVPVVEGYGLSEGTCASTLNPPAGLRKPGTAGLPLPGQQVALMSPDGRMAGAGPGEVVVRGPNVMRGYLNRPGETAAVIVEGWLHTGDVGRFDSDGYLVLVDRIKIPTRVDILDTLPKNAVGKVDKPALRATPRRAVKSRTYLICIPLNARRDPARLNRL
ncbi:MAG: long-chain acyl-CoA synthetase, partial [Pseudonocardiales bacterium]|nr:long-chain acyl-CoA synthetase [Pseudonocardiales bacterium]